VRAVNFFKLYIGDYQRDTAHLSVTEHGAYLLMLQHYYATEKPLPTGKALHRMLRAQDKAEREAIDAVVAEFWHESKDGLVNHRADAEITKAGAQADTNRAIAQAREAKRKGSRTEHEASTNRATNDQPNHSQTPDTTVVAELRQGRAPQAARRASRLPPDWSPSPDDIAFAGSVGLANGKAEAEAAKFRDFWTAKSGKDATKLDWSATWRNWVRRAADEAPRQASHSASTEPEWRREQRERNEAFLGPAAAKRRTTTVDMEATDAAPRLVG